MLLIPLWLQIPTDGEAAHITLSGLIGFIVVYLLVKELRGNGKRTNGGGVESLEYWERMKENVTDPIVEAVKESKDLKSKGTGA